MSKKAAATQLSTADLEALARALQPASMSADQLRASRARVMARIHAPPPRETVTVRGDEIPWEQETAFRQRKLLLRDWERNEQTYLVRMSPGAVSRPHSHEVQEIVWVIEGEIQMGDHAFRAGDLHVAAPGSYHEEFKTTTGALVLIRSQIPPDIPRPQNLRSR